MRVKVWLKSFIPHDYEFAEVVKGTGKHSGKTMIHLPMPVKSSFLTDERGFSTDIDAKARMHSEIEIDVTAGQIVNQVQKCYETTEVDPDTGDEKCLDFSSTENMKFLNFRVEGQTIQVDLEASASNPCVKLASLTLAPHQDYKGTLSLTRQGNQLTVRFVGKIETFPSYEMYVSVEGDTPQTVFKCPPVKGSTVLNLIGGPTREIDDSVTVQLP